MAEHVFDLGEVDHDLLVRIPPPCQSTRRIAAARPAGASKSSSGPRCWTPRGPQTAAGQGDKPAPTKGETADFQAICVKPSVGLEPTTPSLPANRSTADAARRVRRRRPHVIRR